MKAVFKLFCLAGSLSFFMLLPLAPQRACAQAEGLQQITSPDTVLLAQEAPQQTMPAEDAQQHTTRIKSAKHPILMYLPNRIFDLLDIVRVRGRIGPGLSLGVRATKPVSAFVGYHSSVFAGLHGPRGKTKIPWPAGLDARTGVQASIADLSTKVNYYDPLELGLEAQAMLVGFNIGIGVFEILDFATGFLFIDLQGDDF